MNRRLMVFGKQISFPSPPPPRANFLFRFVSYSSNSSYLNFFFQPYLRAFLFVSYCITFYSTSSVKYNWFFFFFLVVSVAIYQIEANLLPPSFWVFEFPLNFPDFSTLTCLRSYLFILKCHLLNRTVFS